MRRTSQRCLIEMDEVPYNGIEKVISGGQDGSDLGGVAAAHANGIKTGGHCPRFWRTASGPNLELKEKYGLTETEATNYQRRTGLNVQNADATIRIASDFSSAGEQLTLKYIQQFQKPYFDVQLPLQKDAKPEIVNRICSWIIDNQIRILNVAGNRDRHTRYGEHYHETFSILMDVFQRTKAILNDN